MLRGAKSIEAELTTLVDELANLRSLMTSVHESCTASEYNLSSKGKERVERVHERMRPAIKHYEDLIKTLRAIVLNISGANHDTCPPTAPILESQIDVQSR